MIRLDKRQQPVKEFEAYLARVTARLSLEKTEIDELKEEWLQHLNDRMHHYLAQGFTEQKAIEMAIEQFGDAELLGAEVNRSCVSARKSLLVKEGLVWLICLVAASVAPGLLIGAHYQLYFTLLPLLCLMLCSAMYHTAIRHASFPFLSFVGFAVFYGSFVITIASANPGRELIRLIVPQRLEDVAGSSGMFTLPGLHLLWIAAIAVLLASGARLRSAVQASFEYWFMIMISLALASSEWLTASSEGKTILINIFLLYAFLQQAVRPQALIKLVHKAAKKKLPL